MSISDKRQPLLAGEITASTSSIYQTGLPKKEFILDAIRHTSNENTFPEDDKIRQLKSSNLLPSSASKGFLNGGNVTLQWLSPEASMYISALIGIEDNGSAIIVLNKLPEDDQEKIKSIIKKHSHPSYFPTHINVRFDKYKNFQFDVDKNGELIPVCFGNWVASIPPEEAAKSRSGLEVKIEQNGQEILIGDKIKLEKNRIQNLLQTPDSLSASGPSQHKTVTPRQKTSGRNAYEIRADIMELAVDWALHLNRTTMNENDVLSIAEAFYKFVENK